MFDIKERSFIHKISLFKTIILGIGWQRRAFLKAYNCVHEDESYHWYKLMKMNTNLDILDKTIIKWIMRRNEMNKSLT